MRLNTKLALVCGVLGIGIMGVGWIQPNEIARWVGAALAIGALLYFLYTLLSHARPAGKSAQAGRLARVAGAHIIKRGGEIKTRLVNLQGSFGALERVSGGVKNTRASKIRHFCRMKVDGQTVIWVRLRGGSEYCFYLGKARTEQRPSYTSEDNIANTRWEVKRVEGGEFGSIDDAVKSRLRDKLGQDS